uniref:Ribosomal protein S4 n=1 Tax=Gloeochaete wittrockiana TaxID=38269 RepID=A0A3G1IW20_9EUKA|nr:ribosomal protein S4 [Gloeochaete wittrockiana]ASQ40256.1 ribosomal protein S4 [Gloeochaete wittrockiana]
MSRYIGPSIKITRRLGPLFGLTKKVPVKRTDPPGQHGKKKNEQLDKKSEYAKRLEEKQKLKFYYGLTERQLIRYVKEARRQKGSTGQILLQLIEMRLDNVLFRLHMAPTLAAARQLINHGHIIVNKNVVSIPSYQCQVNDLIVVKPKDVSKKLVLTHLQNASTSEIPTHLEIDKDELKAKVVSLVDKIWFGLNLNELLVVEYYSRKI